MAIPFASYRLGRAALDQRQFSAVELAALSGVPLNTVYSFIRDLGTRLTSEPQATAHVGRPQNLYTLTEEGIDYLLKRNLELARLMRLGRETDPQREPAYPHAHGGVAEETVREVLSELRDIYAREKTYANRGTAGMKATLQKTKNVIDRLEQSLKATELEPAEAEVKQANNY
jgi:predicted ArsR family transcriptional regulator